MPKHIDPLDGGTDADRAWEEFRVSYSSAVLLCWLLKDLDEMRPDYLEELRERLDVGICTADQLMREDPTYDGDVPIEGPERRSTEFWGYKEANLLEQQLFPHGARTETYAWAARGLALVGLHSALEAYCRSIGALRQRDTLPRSIEGFLARAGATLDSTTASELLIGDETRHLVVHHRGLVSERYVNNVAYNKLLVGERRPIRSRDLQEFADAVWSVAARLHETVG
jgi:hypothetical protein